MENKDNEIGLFKKVDLDELVKSRIKREITELYKKFLYIVEDLDINEYEFNKIRKRVLDFGNDAYRNIENDLNSVNISFKNKKKQ